MCSLLVRLLVAVIALAAFASPALAQSQELILPVVWNGSARAPLHYQTTVRIVSLSSAAVDVTIDAYTSDGIPAQAFAPAPPGSSRTVVRVPALGAVAVFTTGDGPAFRGWARLTVDSAARLDVTAEVGLIAGPVGVYPICERPSTQIVTSTQMEAVAPTTRFAGPAVIGTSRTSFYAFVNPSSSTARVVLSVMDAGGAFSGTATLTVPPQGQVMGLLSDLLAIAPPEVRGSLHVASPVPIGVGGASVLRPDGRVMSLAVIATPLPGACIQVLQPARNPLTGECLTFPTPCDVPVGWERVSICSP